MSNYLASTHLYKLSIAVTQTRRNAQGLKTTYTGNTTPYKPTRDRFRKTRVDVGILSVSKIAIGRKHSETRRIAHGNDCTGLRLKEFLNTLCTTVYSNPTLLDWRGTQEYSMMNSTAMRHGKALSCYHLFLCRSGEGCTNISIIPCSAEHYRHSLFLNVSASIQGAYVFPTPAPSSLLLNLSASIQGGDFLETLCSPTSSCFSGKPYIPTFLNF